MSETRISSLLRKITVLVVVVLIGSVTASGEVIYVDADASPGGDGQTWGTAYKYLQDALAAAASGDEIWFAQGIYKPDRGGGNTPSDREATFQLKNDVAIKGGYAGLGEPDPNARDIEVYETVLSGDLLGNDGPDFANNGENSYHVVTGSSCDETAVLDGVTITAGNAGENQNVPRGCGGGMYNHYGSPTVTNCNFSRNWSGWDGGGMYNLDSSTPTVTNCTFIGNSAKYGGGMYHRGNSNSTITNCTFSGNSARTEGGGMTNYESSSPTLTNCTFSNNSAADKGSGMYNLWQSSPTLTNCTFSGNSAYEGGGMYNYESSSPTLTNCIFSGNSSSENGGGMYNYDSSSPKLTNCTFSGNSAYEGGGMCNYKSSSPKLTNCTFSGNSASEFGGGMYNLWQSSPTVTNCTFIGNSAGAGGGMHNYDDSHPTLTNCTFGGNSANRGGGIANYGGGMDKWPRSSSTLANCILWGNAAPSGPQIYNDGTSSATVNYSDVEEGWPGTGNIDADPCFADADNGDCHLRSEAGRWDPVGESWVKDGVTSPCIDVGDSGSDWSSELWPHGKRINMGAYGGTPEASMSLSDVGNITDLNIDGGVSSKDMKLLTDKWLYEVILLPEDLSRDGIVNFIDVAILANDWGLPCPASNPNPFDGEGGIDTTTDLSWTAGCNATSHDVYFGTSSPPPFVCNQTDTTFEPGTMANDTWYYWRIDEVNASATTTGPVWSFVTMMSPPQ